jgi:hypothetical protein
MTTNELIDTDMTEAEARQVTDRIRGHLAFAWSLVVVAYKRRAWVALGYPSWDKYCEREFGTNRLRLPREERGAMVCALREQGLSIRAIASGVGISDQTVQRDRQSDFNEAVVNHYTLTYGHAEAHAAQPDTPTEPETVTGSDGKTYPKHKPAPPPPNPFVGKFYKALTELMRHAIQLDILTQKPEFATHLEELCRQHREDIVWAHGELTLVLARLGTQTPPPKGKPMDYKEFREFCDANYDPPDYPPADYPPEWTAKQRASTYWYAVNHGFGDAKTLSKIHHDGWRRLAARTEMLP